MTTGGLNGGGTYYVEFTLTDGSGLGDANSHADISNFFVNGGALGAVAPPTLGDVTGGLGGAQTRGLSDSNAGASGLADFTQAFTVSNSGSTIDFNVLLSNTGVDSGAPDAFTFKVLDADFIALPTNGPVGDELVSSDFTSLTPTVSGFTGTGNLTPQIAATITPVTSTVPEPGAVSGLAMGALTLGGLMLRRRRAA